MARTMAASYIETGRHPHWMPAVWSGLIAGAVFLVVEMMLVATISGVRPLPDAASRESF